MVRQSHPTILLTRPLAQSQRFAAGLSPVVISPLMAPEYLAPALPPGEFAAVILTSETGVEAARRISAGQSLPQRAFCVGRRTADQARAAGFAALSADGDGAALTDMILANRPAGPLLYLRGEDIAGEVQNRLISAGIETVSAIVYRQKPQPLTEAAAAVLRGTQPVIVPLFSPRSARLLAQEIRRIGGTAPLRLAVLSPAVAAGFDLPAELIQIAARPDATAMLEIVKRLGS